MASYSQGPYGSGGNQYGISSPLEGQAQPQPPYSESSAGVPSFPATFGTAQSLLSNPMVAGAAVQYGQGLVNMGQSYIDQTVSRFAPGLKRYFAVDTSYVLKKLQIILFPYTHRDWSPQYSDSRPLEPRLDINAPDLYIPAMSLMTYLLLSGYVMGTQQRFTPEDLGINASSLLAWLTFEIIIVWVALFLFKITSHLSLSDTIAYCSYKYVSMIVCIVASLLGGTTAYYIALAWTTAAIAFFEVRSLRLRLHSDVVDGANRMRNYVLLLIALVQPLMVLWLTWSLVSYQPPPSPFHWPDNL
ncbi:PREDICTED: protein YIF1B-B-like isoform X1 [Amphimedon queenslandica]|uniref:Protein YIF1 n=1 Tax=Amphimedon queenslandica TaxID=400682 RepID=A0AAN0ID19_AMPQE|nr:PREDICTED: protein YIF1B-B-like isoform X1 [Amphimedon queenslandica]|eukprot:XP_003385766.1 PREDICTED: protein YIF1B-B-like isoform X1 [Amphimedon queenslandica]